MTYFSLFFFNDTATTEIYTLSLHDALPILLPAARGAWPQREHPRVQHPWTLPGAQPHLPFLQRRRPEVLHRQDRKSTRLNSSHSSISYAVFCLKKKKNQNIIN